MLVDFTGYKFVSYISYMFVGYIRHIFVGYRILAAGLSVTPVTCLSVGSGYRIIGYIGFVFVGYSVKYLFGYKSCAFVGYTGCMFVGNIDNMGIGTFRVCRLHWGPFKRFFLTAPLSATPATCLSGTLVTCVSVESVPVRFFYRLNIFRLQYFGNVFIVHIGTYSSVALVVCSSIA